MLKCVSAETCVYKRLLLQEAIADFTRVLKMHNKNAHAYFRRAFAYKALGMFEQSAQDFETAKVPLAPPPPRPRSHWTPDH